MAHATIRRIAAAGRGARRAVTKFVRPVTNPGSLRETCTVLAWARPNASAPIV